MENRPIKLLMLVTVDWYFWSHRLAIAKAAQKVGMEVVVVTRTGSLRQQLEGEGFKVVEWKNDRKGVNPFAELASLLQLTRIYKREKPDIVHHVAIKPAVYGGIAARLTNITARVATITGLGYVFLGSSLKARLLQPLVRLLLRLGLGGKGSLTVFQNNEDLEELAGHGVVDTSRTVLIRGSGVDIDTYRVEPEPSGVPLVALASRLLWDKGVGEFVEAARILEKRKVAARFALIGDADADNLAAVPSKQLAAWAEEGAVEVWGYRDDMPEVLKSVNVFCLPSYREGLPKALLEAASSGRAIVTTDTLGCREVVRDGENGLLVPARDSKSLADALQHLITHPELRAEMGRRGRERAVSEFSEMTVITATMETYNRLLPGTNGHRNSSPLSRQVKEKAASKR